MTLDLPELLPQIQQAGADMAQQLQASAARLPKAIQALSACGSLDHDSLSAKLAKAGDRWPGAVPTTADLTSTTSSPPPPTTFNVLGADGSQILPDRHSPVLYYLINIGSLLVTVGAGEAPVASTQTRLRFHEDDLYLASGSLIGPEIIHAQRDVQELAELARLAETCRETRTLALVDNGLLLWLALQVQDQPRQIVDELTKAYLGQLSALKAAGAAVAGVIDRPRHANVLALLHLIDLPMEAVTEEALKANPYHRLTDRALFASVLKGGERSPTFIYASPVNRAFRAAGHEIAFFYLRPPGSDDVLRVEIPAWVAETPDLMDLVHAGIIEQGQTTGGFPYVLARAHEIARVGPAERQLVDERLGNTLLAHGVHTRRSQKATTKRWLGGRKRHSL